jgi:hypothetical protein
MHGAAPCYDEFPIGGMSDNIARRGGWVRRTATFVLSAAIAAASCGGSGGGASNAPPAPSGTIVSITVNSSGPTLFLGSAETFTAVATYTSGATQTLIGAAWSTDAPAVAFVDSAGHVTTVANGEVTISAEYQGTRGSKRLHVVPNYGGTWVGNYTIDSCTQTEGFADKDLCATFAVGQTFQYHLLLTQNADVVTGSTAIGLLGSTTVSSTIGSDGSLTLTPQTFVGTVKVDFVWNLTCPQPDAIGGTVTDTWVDAATPGQMVIQGTLQRPTRQ